MQSRLKRSLLDLRQPLLIGPPKSHLKMSNMSNMSDRQSLIAPQTRVKRTSNASQTSGFATWQPSKPETFSSIGPPESIIKMSDIPASHASQTSQTSGFATWQPSRPETFSSIGPPKSIITMSDRQLHIRPQTQVKRTSNVRICDVAAF